MSLPALALALAALGGIWGAMLRLGGGEADRQLLAAFHAGSDPLLSTAARWVTELGAFYTLAALSLAATAVLHRRGLRRRAALLFTLLATGPLFVELQKGWTGRLRPLDELHLVATQSYSFPSGHTANATLIWLGLALLLAHGPRARIAAVAGAALLAVAVGITRVMLGVHWPTDVAAGWALGLFWLLLLFRIFRVPLTSS